MRRYTDRVALEIAVVKPYGHPLVVAAFAIGVAGMSRPAVAPVLVIHGGAGVIGHDMTPTRETQIRVAMTRALQHGHAELAAGKSAVDAVAAALVVLEDDPNFNAGKGSMFTHEGSNQLDAAIMDGHTLNAGAVVGVDHVKNPILLARAVMDKTSYVTLSGAGAEAFAKEQGITLVDPAYFRTDERWQQWQKALKGDAAKPADAKEEAGSQFGSVGAVALDRHGHLAAGTSTGGMNDRRWGRIGDSPVIGAGTYANAACAVASTGGGASYLRAVAAFQICMKVTQMRVPIKRAAAEVINQEIPSMGGRGGAIALDAHGQISIPFNTDGMFRGWIGADGVPHVAIYGDEDDGTVAMPEPASAESVEQP